MDGENYLSELMVHGVEITQADTVQDVANAYSSAMFDLERLTLARYEEFIKRDRGESYHIVHEARIRALGGT